MFDSCMNLEDQINGGRRKESDRQLQGKGERTGGGKVTKPTQEIKRCGRVTGEEKGSLFEVERECYVAFTNIMWLFSILEIDSDQYILFFSHHLPGFKNSSYVGRCCLVTQTI